MFCTQCGTPNPDHARQCVKCKAPLAAVAPVRDRNVRPELEVESMRRPVTVETAVFAGFWRRAAALGLDGLILLVASVAIFVFVPVKELYRELLIFAVHWLYFARGESGLHQATWGKQAFDIKVTNPEGQRITFLRASWRWLAKFFSIATFTLGFALAAVTGKKRALHDYLAYTVVVRKDTLPLAISVGQGTMPLSIGVVAAALFFWIAPFGIGYFTGYNMAGIQGFVTGTVASRVFAETEKVMASVEAYYQRTGKLPTELSDAGLGKDAQFVGGLLVRQPKGVTFLLDIPGMSGATVHYNLETRGGQQKWICTSDSFPKDQLPARCRG